MLIDIEVTPRADFEIEGAMPRSELEHVVQKPDARTNVVPALALNADSDTNVRFACPPFNYGTAHRPSSASTTSSVWRTNPAVTRMQPSHPGSFDRSRTRMPRVASAST